MDFPTRRLLDVNFEEDNISFRNQHFSTQFTRVWNELAQRTTTEKDDLHGIFAALLNLSASEILPLPEGERLKAIIATQAVVPATLFYGLNTTPVGASVESNSWMRLFPCAGSSLLNDNYGWFSVTDGGFQKTALYETLVLIVKDRLPANGTFHLAIPGDALVTVVEYQPCHGQSGTVQETLFLLSYQLHGGKSNYKGARFSIHDKYERHFRVRLETPVEWTQSSSDSAHGDTIVCEKIGGPLDLLDTIDLLILEGKLAILPLS